jgi:hypothetical protein
MFKTILILCMLTIVYADEIFDCHSSNKLCEDKYGWGHVCTVGDYCQFSGWIIVGIVMGCIVLCCCWCSVKDDVEEAFNNLGRGKRNFAPDNDKTLLQEAI